MGATSPAGCSDALPHCYGSVCSACADCSVDVNTVFIKTSYTTNRAKFPPPTSTTLPACRAAPTGVVSATRSGGLPVAAACVTPLHPRSGPGIQGPPVTVSQAHSHNTPSTVSVVRDAVERSTVVYRDKAQSPVPAYERYNRRSCTRKLRSPLVVATTQLAPRAASRHRVGQRLLRRS